MVQQINLFGEEIKVASKAKKFEDVLKELQEIILNKNDKIAYLEESNKQLLEENKQLQTKVKEPQFIELGAFEISKTNQRPLIHIFVDWIGYSMFVKDLKFEKMPKETQDIYQEVWDKHIKPMYKEFCQSFKYDRA
ncbi:MULTISPECIES: hypothetical protein [Clostridium]|uniref:hypothetical protein n=1 Tax=Clostridium TaxID=1485 RepID=UPI0004D8DB31|nr:MULTISPECIES: hypothetical protein [Clostridium]KEH93248.1 hypothetical protein Z963_02605 [Clostridium botulinum C/D str. It1]